MRTTFLLGLACISVNIASGATSYTAQNIGVLGGVSGGRAESEATAISSDGWVTGFSYTSTGVGPRALAWHNGALSELPRLGPNDTSTGGSVGVGGVIGGSSSRWTGTNTIYFSWIYKDGNTQQFMPPGATYGSLSYMNDNGLAIGYAGNSSTGRRGVVWQNGSYTSIGSAGTDSYGYGWSQTEAISRSGTVIGTSDVYDGGGNYLNTRPVLWRNNSLTVLPGLSAGVYAAYASAGNSDDVIVGYSDNPGGGYAAVKWVSGQAISLGNLGSGSSGPGSNAITINDAGDIAGNSEKYVGGIDKGLRGVVWRGGSMHEIGALGADSAGKGYSNIYRMNAAGQVIGTTKKYDASGNLLNYRALYNDTDGTTYFLDTPGDGTGYGFSRLVTIADDGTAYGDYYKYVNGTYVGQFAFAYTPESGMVDLDTLVAGGLAASGWQRLVYVSGMNDAGQLVGYGLRLDGEKQGFVMTPVPEAGTMAIVGTAASGLLIRKRRRP